MHSVISSWERSDLLAAKPSSSSECMDTLARKCDESTFYIIQAVCHALVLLGAENLKGDFQQSLKCLLSMSAGSEGGIIEEDFGAMTDTSEGGGNRFENLSRAGSDDEEDPVATLVNIFGDNKMETIEQVLKVSEVVLPSAIHSRSFAWNRTAPTMPDR